MLKNTLQPIPTDAKDTQAMRRVDQIEVVKVFGGRMREARDLCGMNLVTAAKRLGYRNASKLSKIENASDTNSVPIWLIPKAAKLYMVSVDFLFGFSDDWERSPVVCQQREIAMGLMEHWERARAAELNAFRVLNNRMFTLAKAVSSGLGRAKELKNLVHRIVEINPEWQDIKLGARLERFAIETVEEANGISAELRRYKTFVEVADRSANVGVNADIFDMDGE